MVRSRSDDHSRRRVGDRGDLGDGAIVLGGRKEPQLIAGDVEIADEPVPVLQPPAKSDRRRRLERGQELLRRQRDGRSADDLCRPRDDAQLVAFLQRHADPARSDERRRVARAGDAQAQPLAGDRHRTVARQPGGESIEREHVAVHGISHRSIGDRQRFALGKHRRVAQAELAEVLRAVRRDAGDAARQPEPAARQERHARPPVDLLVAGEAGRQEGARLRDQQDPAVRRNRRVGRVEIDLVVLDGEVFPIGARAVDERADFGIRRVEHARVGRVVAEERRALAEDVDAHVFRGRLHRGRHVPEPLQPGDARVAGLAIRLDRLQHAHVPPLAGRILDPFAPDEQQHVSRAKREIGAAQIEIAIAVVEDGGLAGLGAGIAFHCQRASIVSTVSNVTGQLVRPRHALHLACRLGCRPDAPPVRAPRAHLRA